MTLPFPRSRLTAAIRWLAPSVVAACAGTLVAGVVDGAGPALGGLASMGFIALLVLPALLVLGIAIRVLAIGWQPRALVAGIVDDGGGSPVLFGWLVTIGLGVAAIAWLTFAGTDYLGRTTEFKALTISAIEPALFVGGTLVIALFAGASAAGLTAVARRVDGRWRRAGHRTLLRPRAILTAAGLLVVTMVALVWFVVAAPALGPIDTSVLYAPASAVAVAAVVHLGWRRAGLAGIAAGAIVFAIEVAAIAIAVTFLVADPTATLEIWGERPLAGFAIDTLFDLDNIRAHVALAEFRPVDKPGAAHPDIILVTIDTVRADHTPPYGGTAEMPTLKELGKRGTVFDWAFSPSNVTRRSIPSMVIGLAPNRVKGRVVGWALRVDPRHVLLAERLLAGGYETAGFMCCQGFWSKEAHTGLQRGLEHLEIEANGARLATQARNWLEARERTGDRKPLFLWIHILEPHNWTAIIGTPHTENDRQKFYDRVLTQCDAMLADLMMAFKQRPADRAPIVVVTADHGEALGEHGHEFHSTDLYDSQLHVPFVMAGPGIPAQRVAETVSLTDLVPTLMDLAGFQPPSGPSIDGRSVADLATGARHSTPDGFAFAAMIKDRSNPGGVTAVVQGQWKLIDNAGTLELYDLRTDPNEHIDQAARRADVRDQLEIVLRRRQAAADVSPFP